jgi:Protein of unknown function (DUF1403)/HTH DNA binding domain
MTKGLTTEGSPESREALAPQDWALLVPASVALVRLDERINRASQAVKSGWVSRALIHEATASLRLEGCYVRPQDLMLSVCSSLDRPGDLDLGRAVNTHQMLLSLARRNPKDLFQPRRLIALTRLRLRGGSNSPDPRLPVWLLERMQDAEASKTAIEDSLAPQAVAGWQGQPALAACAGVLSRWHNSGSAACIGGASGRALAMAWAFRAGLISGYWLMPSIGFLGRAADYRPDQEARWTGLFLRAVIEAAEWGLKLESHLRATHHRLLEMAPRARTSSRMIPLADQLISRPAVSAKNVAQGLGLTEHGARAMLLELERQGLIREMSGRKSYRIFTATAF